MTDDGAAYPVGPGHRVSRGPVPEAYIETGSYELGCSNCGAKPETWCTHPDGTLRRIPCPQRMPHNPDPEAIR